MRAVFIPVQGSNPIEVGEQLLLVGRGEHCDVTIENNSVSRQHCILGWTSAGVQVRDLQSSNGCWVNGRRIEKSAVVHPNDLLGIASVQFRLCLSNDDTDDQQGTTDEVKGNKSTQAEHTTRQRLKVEEWRPGLEIFEGCQLIERLGSGGFGEVWRAKRHGFGEIAVKRIPMNDPVRNERRALQAMRGAKHRNVIRIFGYRCQKDVLVVAMELGELTMDSLLTRYQRFGYPGIPVRELIRYTKHVANGLDYLYQSHQVLHRDIKPANVLLVRNIAKLTDFGLAKPLEQEEGLHSGLGSYDYAPPEFFDEKMVPSSDQYSLAAMYVFLASGHLPFPGPDVRQLMMQKYFEEPNLNCIPISQHAVLRRALSRNPVDRFATCTEFVTALSAGISRIATEPLLLRPVSIV